MDLVIGKYFFLTIISNIRGGGGEFNIMLHCQGLIQLRKPVTLHSLSCISGLALQASNSFLSAGKSQAVFLACDAFWLHRNA